MVVVPTARGERAHRVEAVLFDMDGLLVDSEPLWAQVSDAFCRARGARYDEHDERACTGRGIPHMITHLCRRYGFSGDESALVEELLASFEPRAHEAPEKPHASTVLRALHGVMPLALGTSSTRAVIDASFGPRGWLPLFGAIVSGDQVERVKPAPDIYLEAARRLGVDAARCAVFEDSLPGCEAARAAGCIVVAVPEHARDQFASVADLIASDLLEGATALGLAV